MLGGCGFQREVAMHGPQLVLEGHLLKKHQLGLYCWEFALISEHFSKSHTQMFNSSSVAT